MAKLDKLVEKYKPRKNSYAPLANVDPTKEGKYLEWLFKMKYTKADNGKYYSNKDFTVHIYPEVNSALTWLTKNGNNPRLKPEYRDINKFKTPHELISIISPLMIPTKAEIKKEIRKIFEDDKWLILVPKSLAASKLYGMDTKWCTTTSQYFKQYTTNASLYYIIDKSHGSKFGLSIRYSSGFNTNSLVFYNNIDRDLRYRNLVDVYGSTLVNNLLEPIERDFLDNKRRHEVKDKINKSIEALTSLGKLLPNDTQVLETIEKIKTWGL